MDFPIAEVSEPAAPALTPAAPALTVGVQERAAPYTAAPLAYLITFRTYGTWLHGDERGSVDKEHNIPGTPYLPPDPIREARERDLMDQPEYNLDAARCDVVLKTNQEDCQHRQWNLLAAHVRSNHAHIVVQASTNPEKVMTDFKAYASRRLTEAGFENSERKRWSRQAAPATSGRRST